MTPSAPGQHYSYTAARVLYTCQEQRIMQLLHTPAAHPWTIQTMLSVACHNALSFGRQ